jgi:hypothetical protein
MQHWLDRRKPGQNKLHDAAARGRRGRDPLGRLRGPVDHGHAGPADDPQHRPALEGLRRDRRRSFGRVTPTSPTGRSTASGTTVAAGGPRARETAARVAAGGVAREALEDAGAGGPRSRATWSGWAPKAIDRARFDAWRGGAESRSGRRMRSRPRNGRTTSTALQEVRRLRWRGDRGGGATACPRASARPSTASSTRISPRR